MTHEVCLIRHGAAAAAWSESMDPELSSTGCVQARAVAARFAAQTPRTLVTSPLRRAQETAQPLAAHWQCPIEIDERMREIPSTTSLAGRRAWLETIMTSHWPALDASLHAWRASARRAVLDYGRDVLVFTHFMVINALVGLATDDERVVCFEPDYGSVTRLRCTGERLMLVALGDARASMVL